MRILFTSFYIILLFSTVVQARILFDSTRNQDYQIYVMDDDGTNIMKLTNFERPTGHGSVMAPRWSPDGKHIVFSKQVNPRDWRQSHLFLMNADGTNVRELTPPLVPFGRDRHPTFSPDGNSVLFTRHVRIGNGEDKSSVNVINIKSGIIKQITDFSVNDPEFLPDGKKIVYSSLPDVGGSGGNIWIMYANGNHARPLLTPPVGNNLVISRWSPRWSSDGKTMLYTEDRDKLQKIDNVTHYIPQGYRYLICDRDGRNIRELKIPKHLRPSGVDWMDNGKSVVFTASKVTLRQPAGPDFRYNFQIYKFHIATGKLTQLSEHSGNDYYVDWISDDVLSVVPLDKKKVQWGTIKQ